MSAELTSRSRISKTSNRKPKNTKKHQDLPSTLENLCIICAEERPFLAISPCNNATCFVCCFRQRALFGKNVCLVCRTEHPDVIFTEATGSQEPRYDDLFDSSRHIYSETYGAHFTSMSAYNATLDLLDTKCPVCSESFDSFSSLSEHTKTNHLKQYCNICASHKKAFVCELKLYNSKQLNKHMSEGDYEGFSGHPKCKFCRNQRFYSDDELYVHIRDRHERCYICDQDSYNIADYYKNYDHLYEHFKEAHYVCSIPSCVEKRFVVFREDLDLTAHMLKEHGGLTGLNGRVVIGATNYQSQLSTFPRNHSRPNKRDQEDSMEVKRTRLEQRARHYLKNNEESLAEFKKLNQSFKAKTIDAGQLLDNYNDLFTEEGRLDIALLIYELALIYPQHSDQRKQLEDLYNTMVPQESNSPSLNQSFPVLGNGSSSSISLLSWGPGMGPKKSREDLFPKLSKPSRSTSPVIKNGPIKYVKMTKQQPQAKPQVSINNFKGNANYKPNYLDNVSSPNNPLLSLPVLGSSLGGSSSSSTQPSRSQSPVIKSQQNSKLSEKQFPALQKKPTKNIPRVNPIPTNSGTWGSGLSRQAPKPDDTNDFGIPIIDKRAEKLKRKQERQK